MTEQEKINESYCKAVAEAYDADPVLTVSQWADAKRILPQKGAAEPGPYRTDRTPYMREIMDCLSVTSPVQEVIFMAGAQVGKSEGGNNWIGYVIDHAPGPMLMVQPTVDNAKRYSKQRIGPMIAETPTLAARVLENKSRDASNTQLEKEFAGGILLMGGANSAAGLRSMPIRYLMADEISNWPADVDGEGDPLELAQARTSTFSRRKIYKCSTPGRVIAANDDGGDRASLSCRITSEYRRTDMRRYFVPCQHCGTMHTLDFANFVIPRNDAGKPNTRKAYMVCPHCGGIHEEHHKTAMLAGGEWRATNPDAIDPQKRGYQIGALYSPVGWKSWAKVAKEWIDAQGNPKKLQAFYNNVLGLPWEEKGERLDDDALLGRIENYAASPLPAGVCVLTAGVDVQMDRIELEVVGWGRGEESWSIDYRVIYGDPQGPAIWGELDLALRATYLHPAGTGLAVARAAIDTGGGEGVTQATYEYVKTRFGVLPVIGIKGRGGDGIPVIGPPTHSNIAKIPLFPVGTFAGKDTVYGRLRIAEPGPGYCHFPAKHCDKAYFQQLTAEEVRVKVNTKGFPVREYYKVRARNEALDCRVYATAALHSMQVNLDQLADMLAGQWQPQQAERRVRGTMAEAA